MPKSIPSEIMKHHGLFHKKQGKRMRSFCVFKSCVATQTNCFCTVRPELEELKMASNSKCANCDIELLKGLKNCDDESECHEMITKRRKEHHVEILKHHGLHKSKNSRNRLTVMCKICNKMESRRRRVHGCDRCFCTLRPTRDTDNLKLKSNSKCANCKIPLLNGLKNCDNESVCHDMLLKNRNNTQGLPKAVKLKISEKRKNTESDTKHVVGAKKKLQRSKQILNYAENDSSDSENSNSTNDNTESVDNSLEPESTSANKLRIESESESDIKNNISQTNDYHCVSSQENYGGPEQSADMMKSEADTETILEKILYQNCTSRLELDSDKLPEFSELTKTHDQLISENQRLKNKNEEHKTEIAVLKFKVDLLMQKVSQADKDSLSKFFK